MRMTREEMKKKHDGDKDKMHPQKKMKEMPKKNKGLEPSFNFKKKFGLMK